MADLNNISDLRQELIAALQDPQVDSDRILILSNKIAQLDPNGIRFSVDAGHINRLGRELVAKQETAVSELIKNAYDADATTVELLFENSDMPGGTLTIFDDGHGMSREQLVNGFMRLSSTDKIHNPVSPKYGRMRAGRKGIGRFAAQRLGTKLTIITQTEQADFALKVSIDWTNFANDLDLYLITNTLEPVSKSCAHGTTLVIHDLREAWTIAEIRRVYRYIADLIQPFPLSEGSKKSKIDPGFETKLYRSADGQIETVASVEQMVYDYALAEIEAFVDNEGQAAWSISSKQLEITEQLLPIGANSQSPNSKYSYLRSISLKAFYYIYNKGYIPRNQDRFIRDLAKERGGIRVYRNGFRVLPFGEPFDDWLKLDASTSSRLILPPHGNINFFGFVELLDPEGRYFEETSSREGLIESSAFRELVDFAARALKSAALRVAEARERKKLAGQTNWQKPNDDPEATLRQASSSLLQLADRLRQEADKASNQLVVKELATRATILENAANGIEIAITAQQTRTESLLEEISMLRVLASLGLAVGEFTHEIKHLLPNILADANQFLRIHQHGEPREYAERLISNLRNFKTYASYFDSAVSANARRETAPQELGRVIRSFLRVTKTAAERYGVELLEPEINGLDLFTCSMHPSEWTSILFNLFTNSLKAIRRAGSQGKILIRAGRDNSNVFLEFADNGDGIREELKERIFDAFFTTSSPAGPLDEEEDGLLGTGLGLKILKDIVTSYNGEIELVPAPINFPTNFRIELPAASKEELDAHGY